MEPLWLRIVLGVIVAGVLLWMVAEVREWPDHSRRRRALKEYAAIVGAPGFEFTSEEEARVVMRFVIAQDYEGALTLLKRESRGEAARLRIVDPVE